MSSTIRAVEFVAMAFATAALLLSAAPSAAHQDAFFELGPNGTIGGLPREYQPAKLTIDRNEVGQATSAVLELTKGQYSFPACLLPILNLPKGQGILLHGSWYHERSILPPYLAIDLPHHSSPLEGWFDGYSFLFDLRTAKLLELVEVKVELSDAPDYAGTSWLREHAYARLCGGVEPKVVP